ncbi:deoxyribodipyrimidine photo-lyase-like [Tubulanus polymorphus]|uniref:deoxyribodipyrimidine photo-lyase-like n=1 Tax=Tubulanus polymorphus TaxID=672921 RepID=UPI003DA632E3
MLLKSFIGVCKEISSKRFVLHRGIHTTMFPWSPKNEQSAGARGRRRPRSQQQQNSGENIDRPLFTPPEFRRPSSAAGSMSADPNLFSIKKQPLTRNSKPSEEFMAEIQARRLACAASGLKFNAKRKRVISKHENVSTKKQGIVYWMSRDQRVQDNWAFIYAQKLALELKMPLFVCFCVVPEFLGATIRQYTFMLKGLQEVEEECKQLSISFNLLDGYAKDVLPEFVKSKDIGAVVTDFSPLREPLAWLNDLNSELPDDIPLIQVDAHNIVPCWLHGEQEHRAYLMRQRIQSKSAEFLTEFPPITRHPYTSHHLSAEESVNWDEVISSLKVDRSVSEVDWAIPGSSTAFHLLENFCKHRLQHYDADRNNPTKPCTSEMSPWYNFGQISVARCVLTAEDYRKQHPKSVDKYVDEAVTWREMTDNFCFYNPKYDSIEGSPHWSQATLKKHESDRRQYKYSLAEFEAGKTHDDIWNAAQIQMVQEGKMHCFLRMYWAKKILEWSETPQGALSTAIYLNDRYELDGRDPNGYGGCAWAICGVHDREFGERDIYGKVRYMSYRGCQGKFDVGHFVRQYTKKL